MNNKALTLSLVMAVIAIFFVQSYVTSIEDQAKKKFGTEVMVLKAKRDVKEQETLNETTFELGLVPKNFLQPGAISFEQKEEDKETAKSLKALIGTVALVPIKQGEQITTNKITEPNIRTGLAPQIAPGKRAVAIPVSDSTAVGKLVKPGDRIDLIAVLDGGGGKENKVAKTVLQDVIVLAVGHHVTNNIARVVETDVFSKGEKVKSLSEDTSFSTVTLEVDPAQAQVLALVMSGGDNALSLSLRNNDDSERAPLPGVMFNDVLGPDSNRIQRGPAGRR